ncbi:hypothetical protein K502DRAFT_368079 [Neoconidiobolus thromboides FSU 785]|nr:hypothetical protein K502DRAFT_368079 [Neoconidiobolus thromboides FSU 785]
MKTLNLENLVVEMSQFNIPKKEGGDDRLVFEILMGIKKLKEKLNKEKIEIKNSKKIIFQIEGADNSRRNKEIEANKLSVPLLIREKKWQCPQYEKFHHRPSANVGGGDTNGSESKKNEENSIEKELRDNIKNEYDRQLGELFERKGGLVEMELKIKRELEDLEIESISDIISRREELYSTYKEILNEKEKVKKEIIDLKEGEKQLLKGIEQEASFQKEEL